jgi:hypothetical protein
MSVMPMPVEDDVANKEPVLCAWCMTEAISDVQVAGRPVCQVHRHEIEAEMKVNAGRTLTPTRAERAMRQEGFRKLIELEADWQDRQRWTGR